MASPGPLRILHTSDWHLGRSFGPESLLGEQQAFADWIVGVAAEREVDLVVIAGDVFDRAVPPADAVELYTATLRRLVGERRRIAVIAGNHDGPERLALYDTLLDDAGLFVRGGYGHAGEVVRLEMRDGPLDLVLLPFLDPQAAPDDAPAGGGDGTAPADAGLSGGADEPAIEDPVRRRLRRTHESVLRAAIATARAALSAPRSLAVAHAYVRDAAASDSERDLAVGGAGMVDGGLFEGFSYTALGHLHAPQWVGGAAGSRRVRYSGTPLAYSFSETAAKSVTLVEMSPGGDCGTEEIAVPVGRRVRTVRGTLDELLAVEVTAEVRESRVRAILTDRGVVLDAKRHLAERYPHVVEIVMEAAAAPPPRALGPVAAGERLDEFATMLEFWRAATGDEPSPAQGELLGEALAAARQGRGGEA